MLAILSITNMVTFYDLNFLSVSVLIFKMRAELISITGSKNWLWKHWESTQLSQEKFFIFDPKPGLLMPHDMTSFSCLCSSELFHMSIIPTTVVIAYFYLIENIVLLQIQL